MPRWRRLAGWSLRSRSLMAGSLEELTDGDLQCVRDSRDRRGPGIDPLALGTGDRLSEQPAPISHVGQAKAPYLPDSLYALHSISCVNDNVTRVKIDGCVRALAGLPPR